MKILACVDIRESRVKLSPTTCPFRIVFEVKLNYYELKDASQAYSRVS